jgi:transcriptional regulator with XRE-family HTH domain
MQQAQQKLGKRIRGLREKKGLSQEAFADLCGLNRVHMGDVERGNVNLTITTLDKIARNLGSTSSTLLKGIL